MRQAESPEQLGVLLVHIPIWCLKTH